MSTNHDNAFLPSGAITLPPYEISHLLASTTSNLHYPIFQHHLLMSPPEFCSGSANDINASLTDNWCEFVQKLRNQFQGERAHLRADLARMQEVIEGERELWDRERQLWCSERKALKTRILALESKLTSTSGVNSNKTKVSPLPVGGPPVTWQESHEIFRLPQIPQESGRNADGSPFYAPVSHNPTRTFHPDIAHDLRVDDLVTPQENAIRVTSKKLTSSDFVQQASPPLTADSVSETIAEAIDISHIQPELDSVAIRISAVSPTFAAKVLSSRGSPSSPESKSRSVLDANPGKISQNIEEICEPLLSAPSENKRLTLFAGHTPSHSLFKLDCLKNESRSLGHIRKPREEHLNSDTSAEYSYGQKVKDLSCHGKEIDDDDDDGDDGDDDDDKELSEPLGILNESESDDIFLARLTQKLAEEAQKIQSSSLTNDSVMSPNESPDSPLLSCEPVKEEPEAPILRIKASMNFGRPFGLV